MASSVGVLDKRYRYRSDGRLMNVAGVAKENRQQQEDVADRVVG